MADPPKWFTTSLRAPVEEHEVSVGGVAVRYRAWGERGAPGAVLVHGIAAHARWWDHVAPALARSRRIVALDLSGHGDSGKPGEYDLDRWAGEVLAVAEHAGIGGRPEIVGHSVGGLIAIRAAIRAGATLSGLVVIDSVVRTPSEDDLRRRRTRALRQPYVYADRAAALEAFHPIPDEPNAIPYVLDHVAATSLHRVGSGWSWKFDLRVFGNVTLGDDDLRPVEPPVSVMRCEHGLMPPDMGELVARRLGGPAQVVTVPGAGHHAMLDVPLALRAALDDVLTAHLGRRPAAAS